MTEKKKCDVVYGISTSDDVTPIMVHDSIIECFRQAHCADAGIESKDIDLNKAYCREIVRKAFVDTGADFDNPTKEDIMKVLGKLAEFSMKFRDKEMVKKHQNEIMKLVKKL